MFPAMLRNLMELVRHIGWLQRVNVIVLVITTLWKVYNDFGVITRLDISSLVLLGSVCSTFAAILAAAGRVLKERKQDEINRRNDARHRKIIILVADNILPFIKAHVEVHREGQNAYNNLLSAIQTLKDEKIGKAE
jgi:hypothetical protein